MKQLFILLAVALLIPLATAFDCRTLNENDRYICNYIQNNNLSQAEKDLIISDIFNLNKTTANHDFIYYWNTALKIPNNPDNRTTNQGTIKKAWLKIITLMPSVLENNILYGSRNGKLMTAYNYSVQLPSGRLPGDCRTTYSLLSKGQMLNIYLNGNLIGHDKLTSFALGSPTDLNFNAILIITVKYRIKHYTRNDEGDCVYDSREDKIDNLGLTDNFNAKAYRQVPQSYFKITDKIQDTTKGFLESSNYTSLILSFNDSYYQNRKYVYHLNYSLPYYILTIRAEPFNETISNNIYIEEQNNKILFTVKNTNNCQIKLFDHFHSTLKNCDLVYNAVNLSIITDKLNYYDNETIKVTIFPQNITVNLTYANITKIAQGNIDINSTLYENKISAVFNDEKAEKFVNVQKRENMIIVYNLCIFSFFSFCVYKFLRTTYLNFDLI